MRFKIPLFCSTFNRIISKDFSHENLMTSSLGHILPSFLSLRSIQVGLPAVDRGEGEVGTGEPDEAELGDDGADGDLLLFLFTDKSTGSI
jgi:hypothetical protein